MKTHPLFCLSGILVITIPNVLGQLAPKSQQKNEEIIELSPFTVSSTTDVGYTATSTLAGTRLRTDLKDLGSAISVITKEFLKDTGATDAGTLLSYTTNTEVGGGSGKLHRRRGRRHRSH